ARYFDRVAGGYRARFYDQDSLTINPASGEAIVTDPAGDQLHFTGYGYGVPGPLSSFVDPAGNTTPGVARTPHRQGGEVQRGLGAAPEPSPTQSRPGGGPTGGRPQTAPLRRSADGGRTWTTVRQVAYAYYGPGQPYGNVGDLLSATLRDGAGRALDADYYRYD